MLTSDWVLRRDGKMVYSKDIRWCIVRMYYGLRYPIQWISRNLDISSATVRRIINRFTVYADVSPYKIGRINISQVLAPPQINVVMEYVLRNPNAYVKEMIQHLTTVTGSACEAESLRLLLRYHGFSYKRVSWYFCRFYNTSVAFHVIKCCCCLFFTVEKDCITKKIWSGQSVPSDSVCLSSWGTRFHWWIFLCKDKRSYHKTTYNTACRNIYCYKIVVLFLKIY